MTDYQSKLQLSQVAPKYYVAYHGPNKVHLGDIMLGVDGYYVFYPEETSCGFDEYYLKLVLNTLEDLNLSYKEKVGDSNGR